MSEEDEAVECLQCGWPLLRGQSWSLTYRLCDDCGIVHPSGIVHLEVCALDMAMGVERVTTQHKRAGVLGLN